MNKEYFLLTREQGGREAHGARRQAYQQGRTVPCAGYFGGGTLGCPGARRPWGWGWGEGAPKPPAKAKKTHIMMQIIK